ncbi:MAG: hypothetical protein RPU61_15245 [Candidatus Sedimenticola sp. (ex Thyasira tokunagai)]
MTISNDRDLRNLLDSLSTDQQRTLGARFADSVISLADNPQLKSALEAAADAACSDAQLEDAYKTTKSIAVQTYTACGRDADWKAQAEHFVATSCAAALTPDSRLTEKMNPAWRAAIQARMARNCIMMDAADDELQNEAEAQYRIADEFNNG